MTIEAVPEDFQFKRALGGFEVRCKIEGRDVSIGWVGPHGGGWTGETPDSEKTFRDMTRQRVVRKLLDYHLVSQGLRQPKPKPEPAPIAVPTTPAPVVLHAPPELNREGWLTALARAMEPWFEEMGYPVGKYRVSVGLGMKSNVYGVCYRNECSLDGHAEILLSTTIDNEAKLACVLAHEMIHAALPDKEGHSPRFRNMAITLGLLTKKKDKDGKETINRASRWFDDGAIMEGQEFLTRVAPILAALGPFPGRRMYTLKEWKDRQKATGGKKR